MRAAQRVARIISVAVILAAAGCPGSTEDVKSPRSADFVSPDGRIAVSQVRQMGVVIETPAGVIYADPTGGRAPYADHPAPDVVLISHEHHENYDAGTLEAVMGPGTRLVVPPYVLDSLPERLRAGAVPLANGERSASGPMTIEAVPAYGLSGEAEEWHPRGRGNGYVVTVDNRRLSVAGSTEAVPETLRLTDIFLAFLPLHPPYALNPEDAVRMVSAQRPEHAYIYQYDSEATRDEFVAAMEQSPTGTAVVAPDIPS